MKLKLIMLETKERAKFGEYCLCKKDNKIKFQRGEYFDKKLNFYLIDESAEIEEDDWFIKDNLITQCNETSEGELGCIPDNEIFCNTQTYFDRRNCSKIIASTDKSLTAPFGGQDIFDKPAILSEQSIKLLVDYYNQYNKMPDINQIIRLMDGIIDINIPKEKMYSRKEVIELIEEFGEYLFIENARGDGWYSNTDNWISQNLK